MVVNWREKKECGHDAKEGADKDSVYFSVPLKSVGLNLLMEKLICMVRKTIATSGDLAHFNQS